MSKWIFSKCGFCSVLVVLAVAALPLVGYCSQRSFTVQDAIRVSTFLKSHKPSGNDYLPGVAVTFSPDVTHFIAVTARGQTSTGKRAGTIWLFDTERVRNYLYGSGPASFSMGSVLLRMSTASNQAPISAWRWSVNSRSVLFIGADDEGVSHLYRVFLNGKLKELSLPEQDVDAFAECSGVVVYLAHVAVPESGLYQAAGGSIKDIQDGTGKSELQLLFPEWEDHEFGLGMDKVWVLRTGAPKALLSTNDSRQLEVSSSGWPSLSPNGRFLLTTSYVAQPPKSWDRYLAELAGLTKVTVSSAKLGGTYRAQQYAVLDMTHGTLTPLIDAPIGWGALFYGTVLGAWSPDGLRVAVSATYFPSHMRVGAPATLCDLAVIGLKWRGVVCLKSNVGVPASNSHVVSMVWRGNKTIVATYAPAGSFADLTIVCYVESSNGIWHAKSESERGAVGAPNNLHVAVDQGPDKPPVLTAWLTHRRKHLLLNPNSEFDHIALGRAVPYRWADARGYVWSGMLTMPPNYVAGRRYPLVIQTHGLYPHGFLVDGPSHAGYAARALAARGILVLQVFESATPEILKYEGTSKEPKIGADAYQAAIKRLTMTGLVDPGRVGIIGWSHAGIYVWHTLIDDPATYKAVILSEPSTYVYSEYLANVDYLGTLREEEIASVVGAAPWGAGLKAWMHRATDFNADRICAPILFYLNSPTALVYGWGAYAILRAQNKPVDLLYIRDGSHVLEKPRERLAEQERTVAWFDYWLNGRVDAGFATGGEYRRWEGMRTMPACPRPDRG